MRHVFPLLVLKLGFSSGVSKMFESTACGSSSMEHYYQPHPFEELFGGE
jgi:hypothetical protein